MFSKTKFEEELGDSTQHYPTTAFHVYKSDSGGWEIQVKVEKDCNQVNEDLTFWRLVAG